MNRYNKTSKFPIILFVIISVTIIAYLLQNKNSNPIDNQKIQDIVKNTIISNPEIIIESLEKYQIQKNKEVEEKSKDFLKSKQAELEANSAPNNHIEDYDIIVIEFFDYNCGYCKRSSQALDKLALEDKHIKIIYKELPILNENSIEAARFALAVNSIEPNKYAEFHNKLMTEKPVDISNIAIVINEMGFNKDELEKLKSSESISQELSNNKNMASQLNIQGTPAFIINGELIPGSLDYEGFKQKVKTIREKRTK